MKLEESIVVLNWDFNEDLVKSLIKYTDKKAKKKLPVMSGLKLDIRNVKGHHLHEDSISDTIYFRHIENLIRLSFPNYRARFPYCELSKLVQIDLLKYEPGGVYDIHVDHLYPDTPRTMSVIIGLNDDFEGGELTFFHPTRTKEELKRIRTKKGAIVFFPSFHLFPHKIQPITKGKRYSIVAWLQ